MDCVDHQAPLSTGFSMQELWSGSPFSSPNICILFIKNVLYKFDGLKSKIQTSFNLSAKLSFFFSSKISGSKINNNYDAAFYLTVCSRNQQHLNHRKHFKTCIFSGCTLDLLNQKLHVTQSPGDSSVHSRDVLEAYTLSSSLIFFFFFENL